MARIFISSTRDDLVKYREKVRDALAKAGHVPVGMEDFPASDRRPLAQCRADVASCAVYVGIFAWRLGFVPTEENLEGKSITELELRHAQSRGMPCLIFLLKEGVLWLPEHIDYGAKPRPIDRLRDMLRAEFTIDFFTSPDDLATRVLVAVGKTVQEDQPRSTTLDRPEPRATPPRVVPPPPKLYAVPPYTLTNTFVGRRAELSELNAWAVSPDPVLVVEAIGGMGKSALTWEWVQEAAASHLSGLAGRMWWSFYERGTSMKTFLRHALAYVTGQDPEALDKLDTFDCGQQLLAELRRKPYLLVLDGFERVLTAYHLLDKAQVRDDRVPADKRECTNPRDGDVLRQLVHCGPSKVLVSTRLMPKVLEDRSTHFPIPGVRHLELEGLAREDALGMVRHTGVRGDSSDILRFNDQFGRHPLVLRIVCGMVNDYRSKPGDFDAWHADPYAGGGLKLSELPLVQRYTHILEHAFRGLGEKQRQLLSRIAVLSDSAHYDMIVVLNPFLPPQSEEVPESEHHEGIANFHVALGDLEERGLLQWDRPTNIYDLHPVVRAYAFEQLEERDRAKTYNSIRDHFASMPPEDIEGATELVHVKNSIEIMRALIGAGKFEEAFAFYQGDLAVVLEFSIGFFHGIIELLTSLLRRDRTVISPLTNAARISATGWLCNALADLDRFEDAILLLRETLPLTLELENWSALVAELRALAICLWGMNRLAAAVQLSKLAYELSTATGEEDMITRTILDHAFEATSMGDFNKAELLLTSFMRREQPPRAIYRQGRAEFEFALLGFRQNRLKEEDLKHAEHAATEGRNLSSIRLLAVLRAEWELARGNFAASLDAIEKALSIARKTGEVRVGYSAIRALALACLGQAAQAREALADIEENLDDRRYLLFAGEAYFILGDLAQARKAALWAFRHAWADGPPYSHWYGLKKCRDLLTRLGEPEPRLPPFDPRKVEPIPFEAEIRDAILWLKIEAETGNLQDRVEG